MEAVVFFTGSSMCETQHTEPTAMGMSQSQSRFWKGTVGGTPVGLECRGAWMPAKAGGLISMVQRP